MESWRLLCIVVELILLVSVCSVHQSFAQNLLGNGTTTLRVNASAGSGRSIPNTLFGIFIEELNHAGAGGFWAELVNNRGFEAGDIKPWTVIGDNSSVAISTDKTSCFERNKVALKMEVLCDKCPEGGVGIYNPGYWGMNIEKGKKYKLIFYSMSKSSTNINVSLTDATGSISLASGNIHSSLNWTKQEIELMAEGTSDTARLQFTLNNKATIWFDQVSLMPLDTFKGHGFRKDIVEMLDALKPGFLRFPGGCYVEGNVLKNAFSWNNTVGPWEERPGHFGDIWNYWSDDGIGFFEYLQLAEDLNTTPVWVFNSGNSHKESVDPQHVQPYVQDALDGLEFAMGSIDSKWGSVRSKMGHPKPFKIGIVGVGNEDCTLPHYEENYMAFNKAIKNAYPDIKLIHNCDGSSVHLHNPADYYDFHIYGNDANQLFNMANQFNKALRAGPKAFVSEYAVRGTDGKNGTLLAALGEAAFLIGLENNSDLVEMSCYAPLFANVNDRVWTPSATVFNSSHSYGTPSYYMQKFFVESNGASLLGSTLESDNPKLVANAIQWKNKGEDFLRVKAVNFGSSPVIVTIHVDGAKLGGQSAKKLVLTSESNDAMIENYLDEPLKITPKEDRLEVAEGKDIILDISPFSITSVDFPIGKR